MNCRSRFYIIVILFLLNATTLFAEYRAYELEVFDRIANTSRKVITSFSPTDFIQVKVMALKKFKISDDYKLKEFFNINESNSNNKKLYYGPYKNRKVKKTLINLIWF